MNLFSRKYYLPPICKISKPKISILLAPQKTNYYLLVTWHWEYLLTNNFNFSSNVMSISYLPNIGIYSTC
ncbi:MAG: hypothetical protein FD166_1378 [Bacteroidetes bacterium]|nr:MAG: hypothetical protein FD166_1378 [Bacteroidota bacterium]